MTDLQKQITAILFSQGEPISFKDLGEYLSCTQEEVKKALEEMPSFSPLTFLTHDNAVSIVTEPEYGPLIECILKAEREKDLGKASLEVLAIVAYKGPVSRKEIEYIRGVNCQFAIHTLLLRGLITKTSGALDERVMLYTLTEDALRHLGLTKISDLPGYTEARTELEQTEKKEEENIDE